MLSCKKIKLILVSVFTSLLLIGCTGGQPTFNPNNNGLVVVEGRTYLVPLEAHYTARVFRSKNDEGVLKLRQAGLDCRKGDISWISAEVQQSAQEARLDGDLNRAASIIIEAPRKGQIGCAHPLSKKEYEYYREKQKDK